MLPRAYPPRDLRQQDADRLVTTEDELRSVITAALSGNAVANVRLGADIFLTSTILVPLSSALRGIQFDGCGRYGIFATGSMAAIFTVASLTSKVGNVASAPLAFAGITLGAKTFNLFALFDGVTGGAGPLFATLQMTHVRITNTLNFVNTFADHPASFTFSTFVDVTASNTVTGAALSIGGIATDSAFFAVKSNLTWALSSASARCCFVDCPGIESLASSLLAGPNTIIGRSSRSLIPSDLLLGGSLALAPSSATLSSAGPTLTPGSSSFMRLTFTAGASGNITVAAGFDGQMLRLYCAAVAGTAVFTSGAGNLFLAGTFTPSAGAVLELQYDLTTATWVEVSRSSSAVALASDPRFWVGAEGGYGQNFLRSSLPSSTAGFTMVSGDAMFVYLGLVKVARTVNFVKFFVGTIGAGAQTAEVGLFSTPAAPNGSGQSLTSLGSTNALDALTATGIKGNSNPLAVAVPAGTHLWAGLRTAMVTTQPAIGGVGLDYAQGHILKCAASGVLTGAGPFVGTVLAAAASAAQAPGLMGYP